MVLIEWPPHADVLTTKHALDLLRTAVETKPDTPFYLGTVRCYCVKDTTIVLCAFCVPSA
jgi:hypothetical protein